MIGVVLDGRYKLVAPLAEGAMGSVYRAERVGLEREVAVKIMHATLPGAMAARERFEREAQLMAKLAHRHCVSVIDFGVHEDKPYLVMELVQGQNLSDVIAAGRLPVPRAADIARQILAGLAHAHAQDIIHRDIKPANIMVSPKEALGDHVQILDFGLARLRESSSLLTEGLTVGTPSYMAPEQCRGAKLDARVDLYSCGVVLYEMVTGKKPFVAADPLAVVKLQLTQPPPRLDGPLGDVVARALAKDPNDRFASAVDMAAAIVSAVPGMRATTHPAGVPVIPTLGSSALVPLDEPSTAGVVPDAMLDPSGARPPAAPLDPHEASLLRRMLPRSRMKWMALFLLILVAGGIYGIVRAKQYLAEQSATGATTCPPLQVKIDGKPLAAPTHGLAWVGPGGSVAVEVFDHDGVTCDELYVRQRNGRRDVPAGEVSVGAWAGDKEPAPTGVSFASNTQLHTTRSVAGHLSVEVTKRPGRPGDRVALCVRDVVTIPLGAKQPRGVATHPEAEIRGTLEGQFCPPPR